VLDADAVKDVCHFRFLSLVLVAGLVVGVLAALDRLGDALDALETGAQAAPTSVSWAMARASWA
jgi:hypothetical protein